MNRRTCLVAIFWVLTGVIGAGGGTRAFGQRAGADIVCKRSIEIRLEEEGDSLFTAESDVAAEYTFLSENAALPDEYNIYESVFTPISKLKGKFNSSTLDDDELASHRAGNEDVFLTEDKVYTLRIPKTIRSGDRFSFSYRQKFADIAFLPILEIPNIDSLREFRLSVKHPEEWNISFDIYYPADSVPVRIGNPGEDETILSCGPLRGLRRLAYYPLQYARAFILLRVARGEKVFYPPTPERFLAWYGKKTTLQPRLGPGHEGVLAGSIDSSMTNEAKLRAINTFIRTSVRYIADERGLNAIVPREPGVVAEMKYGDCKDRASLACAIARNYGVDAHMALISTDPTPRFTDVSPNLFNHMICAFTQGGATRFFDPTAKYCEFGNLPEEEIGARVLVLDPRAPRWETAGVPDRKASIEVAIRVSLDSLSAGKAVVTMRNSAASGARHAAHDLAEDQLKHYLQSMITSNLEQLRLTGFSSLSEDERTVVVKAVADCSRFIIKSGKKYYVQKYPFLTHESGVLQREGDPAPLGFSRSEAIQLSVSVAGSLAGIQGDSLEVSAGGGEIRFSGKIERAGSEATVRYDYNRPLKYFAGRDKEEYIAFLKNLLRQKKSLFTILTN